jgi:hypothetical protein
LCPRTKLFPFLTTEIYTILFLGAYYCLNMGMIATSTFLCTIVVHIYFRGSGPMPTILRRVLFKDLFFFKKKLFRFVFY